MGTGWQRLDVASVLSQCPPLRYLPGTDLMHDRSTHGNVASRNWAKPLARQIEGDMALSFRGRFFSRPHRQINKIHPGVTAKLQERASQLTRVSWGRAGKGCRRGEAG